MLKEGNIKSFCIPIWGPICLPAKLRYEIPAELEVSASVKFEISFEATASASASMGVSWSSGRGLRPQFDTNFNVDLSKEVSTTAEGRAELTGTITPTLLLDVPAPGLPINIPIPRWLLPKFLKRLLGFSSSGRSAITLMSPAVEMPIFGSVFGEFCLDGLTPALKLLGYKAGVEEITAGVEVGVGSLTVDVEVSIPIEATIGDEQKFNDCEDETTTKGKINPPKTPGPTDAPRTTDIPTTSDSPTTAPPAPTTAPHAPTTPPYAPTTPPYAHTTPPYAPTTPPYAHTTPLYQPTAPDSPTPIPDTSTPDAPAAETTHITGTSDTPDITTVPTSTAAPCSIDLVFLLDGSWSIGRVHFEEIKEYIRDVIGCLDNTHINVSVISYDKMPMTYITLGEYTSTSNLQYLIMSQVVFHGSLTRTGYAIYSMANSVPFHPSVHKSAVVVTDGWSQSDVDGKNQDGYAESAQEARDAGIELFCIGAGRDAFIYYDGLNGITDNPARVVHWRQVDPCLFAAILLTELCG
ncbi:uncharacterized protein LOC118427704 isoform X1 [Branchiostoma floridae]|uniref:Uncharacterized protein LOC118427704 isoform X1 n=1 Tax=Branchiostoma floridae TaxID=7739 RepID=A0A9J7M3G2_BRAFL|nr:uncharacterized protein LOC118427704 isoform X1 [Branchiostoma floridae]